MLRFYVCVFLTLAFMTWAGASVLEVHVRASWTQTPILAEASEAVAAFDPDAFWHFVDMTAPTAAKLREQLELEGQPLPPEPTVTSTQLDQYSKVLGLIPALIFSEAQQKLARSEIASRAFSPRVVAHHDLARRALLTTPDGEICQEDAFFDFGGGRIVCDEKEFDDALLSAATLCHSPPAVPLEDEHVLRPDATVAQANPRSCSPQAILYGVLGTKSTLRFVSLARQTAKSGKGTFIFRHYLPNASELNYPLAVQGYGVTVDVKNMEYKTVDDKGKDDGATPTFPPVAGVDFEVLLKRYPEFQANLSGFAHAATQRMSDELDLKVWETQRLGLQTAHKVLSSATPMATLLDLTENFPARVGAISRTLTDEKYEGTAAATQVLANMFGDQNRLWINGRPIDPKHHDFFSVLAELRGEESQINRVQTTLLGKLDRQDTFWRETRRVVNCPIRAPDEGEKPRLWVDESVPLWINDIETDDAYATLAENINTISRPGPYGQPRFVKRNLLNVLYVIDPTDRSHLEAMASFVRVYQQGAPVRFGFVFAWPAQVVEAAEKALGETENSSEAVQVPLLLASVLEALRGMDDKSAPIMYLVRLLYSLGQSPFLTEDAIRIAARGFGVQNVDVSPSVAIIMRNESAKAQKLGLFTLPVAIFNGKVFHDAIEDVIYRHFNAEFARLQNLVATKQVTDDTKDIYGAIHERGGAVKRYQPAIFDEARFVPWTGHSHERFLESLTWLYAVDFNLEVCDVSHIVAVNLSTAEGFRDLRTALGYLSSCRGTCMKTRFAVAPVDSGRLSAVTVAVLHHANTLPEKKRIAFVAQFVKSLGDFLTDDAFQDDGTINSAVHAVLRDLGSSYQTVLQWSPDFELGVTNRMLMLVRPSGYSHSGSIVHTNGRVTNIDASFEMEDFTTLERQERDQRGAIVASCIDGLDFGKLSGGKLSGDDLTAEYHANKIFMLSSVLAAGIVRQGAKTPPSHMPPESPGSSFLVTPSSTTRHTITAVLDPVSRPAQKLVALINFLTSALNVSARIHLNPNRNLQKVPVKNYYRFVAAAELQFNGTTVIAPKATMRGLPTNVVLTVGVDDPDSWLTVASEADADLDNVQLSPGSKHVERAVYTLESLVVTGACMDMNRVSPPRGMPIELVDSHGVRDTLVMSNYGYFQLPARPGIGELRVQPGGRAEAIYEIESVNGVANPAIAVSSFAGAHVELRVRRRPGQEAADLLVSEADSQKGGSGLFGSVFGRVVEPWPPKTGDQPERPKKPTLNVFSLASGHLYERFLRIMMHTVMQSSSDIHGKNTTRIKFWLIENPMSPRFKRLLPRLAEKYGFEYGLVKYKWPHWLTRQTEKQRMIWAYKVLFLDVLFPLDVEKVIFVDADQIVRADLHELYHLDLQGKPVAYTPFCRRNEREDTKGFRFWDSGYWKDHLAGKPYHISAIYVVDVVRLRQLAAGDRYRMIYDNLAQDPNSLANLDQDLPNFAQHQIPIFSLPEEWLWCETWCNNASKQNAKTIDLCNNPLTKAPKLESAKRIIPNWEQMDRELQEFEDAVVAAENENSEL